MISHPIILHSFPPLPLVPQTPNVIHISCKVNIPSQTGWRYSQFTLWLKKVKRYFCRLSWQFSTAFWKEGRKGGREEKVFTLTNSHVYGEFFKL